MAQNNGGRGGPQQNITQNEAISLQQRLQFVLGQLKTREAELSATLPPDLPFERFHATVNQALRNNPDLLQCTPLSLVNSCVKSAYDGLRLDGREAALVSHNVKVKVPGQKDRWEKQAQYFPMVFGLIQQVLRGGMVVAIETDIIYENDRYRVIRGTAPAIEHEPELVLPRGEMIAAYSVAVFPSGYRSTIVMTRAEIEDVRATSKSGVNEDGDAQGIWKRWPGEMAKKTVVRRHRKTLPIGRDIVINDAEANEEFPALDRSTPHPQLAATPRPTRAAITSAAGTESGHDLDFGDRGEVVDNGRGEEEREQQQAQQQQEAPQEEKAKDEPEIVLPEDEKAWAVWGTTVENDIRNAADVAAVDQVWAAAGAVLKHASKAIKDRLNGEIADRKTELALEAAGAAGNIGA